MLIITNLITLAVSAVVSLVAIQMIFKVIGGKGYWWNAVVNSEKVNEIMMKKAEL